MLALEQARGFGHSSLIERPGIVQRATVIERRQYPAPIDAIAIRLTLREPARMKCGADLPRRRRCGSRAGEAR